MQALSFRYVSVLITTLIAGAVLYAALGEPRGGGNPRWPSADSMYTLEGWSAGPEQLEDGGFRTRTFTRTDGQTAQLSIYSNQAPKLYAAGAEVPYLGNGYVVQTSTSGAVLPELGDSIHGLIATRGAEQWLVFYAYGERRGLLGNGPGAWALALFDLVLGNENDYYKIYLTTRSVGADPEGARVVGQLATMLFSRIAAYYAG
jgi:hypothetical protein